MENLHWAPHNMDVKLGHNSCFVNVVCLIWTKAGNSFEFVRRIIVREFPLLPSPLITFWWPLRLICVWTHHHLWNFLLWSLTLGQYFFRPFCRHRFWQIEYVKYSSKYYIYTEAHILEQKKTKCCSFLLFCCILYLINPVFREKIEMFGINVNIIQPGTKYMGHSTRLHIHGIPAFGIYYNWQKVS